MRITGYDPKNWGAKLDGQTDDTEQLQAMLDDMPTSGGLINWTGRAWISAPLRISKPIRIVGSGGTTAIHNGDGFGLECAPGIKAAVIIDSGAVSVDGYDASQGFFGNFDLESKILIHPSANGSAIGYGLKVYFANENVRLGELHVKESGASPTLCFRPISMTANNGRGPATFPASQPAWSSTLNATIVDSNGTTWRTEQLPSVRQNNHVYAQYERVWADGDNRFYFECETPGTTANSPPTEMLSHKQAGGVVIDGYFTDGYVGWRTKYAVGLFLRAGLYDIGSIDVRGFSNAGVMVVGGAGQDAAGTTNADNFIIHRIIANYCGLGCYIQGDDSNGYGIWQLWGLNLGTLQPTPNAVVAANYRGLGGHILHCNSLASGRISNFYAQLSSGRPILKTGLGLMSVGGFQEITQPGFEDETESYCKAGEVHVDFGSIIFTDDSLGVLQIGTTTGRGIGQLDRIPAQDRYAYMIFPNSGTPEASKFYTFQAVTTGTSSGQAGVFGWVYNYQTPSGFYGLQHGSQNVHNALLLGGPQALGFCGWAAIPDGLYIGDSGSITPLFTGPYHALKNSQKREGAIKKGDRFQLEDIDVVALEDGYRGTIWTMNTTASADFQDWGFCATIREPTATDGYVGGKVFKCTDGGTTGGSEPNWATATNVGDTVPDNDVTWTLAGFVPAMSTQKVTTTTNTAGQRIAHIPIKAGTSTTIGVSVQGDKASTDDCVTALIRGSFKRNGSGNVIAIGTDQVRIDKSGGLAIDDTTGIYFVAGTTYVEVRVDPGETVTLVWMTNINREEGKSI